ncbi:unnamed protein product [Adineta steineri]|uniref:Uncharacterized protein n=1 Tax=Adineta steineri TaxID=433720 RepID=A0A814BIR0_9BILA|nr:unnamed protein product [Adineta steineri]
MCATNNSTVTTAGTASGDLNSNHECVTFVWLDLRRETTGTFIGALRSINDCVQTYTDMSTCLDSIRSSNEIIFFISSTSNAEFLAELHDCVNVEAIFILDPDMNTIRGEFPKITGIFNQQEELLRVLRVTLDTFEQLQLEKFTFETDKMFLWWQLWKESITIKNPASNCKNDLVEKARDYYRTNPKRLKIIEEFDKGYRSNDAIRWCFRSIFPSRPLRYALYSRLGELLSSYQFLTTNVSRSIQQQSKQPNHGQLFRGMKLPAELIDMFETHTGQLVCANGFFMCSKMRNVELQSAASPGYRTDLISVLFKIDFDASAHFAEVLLENNSTIIVFDVATSFRVICVNRGPMSIIKLKTAVEDGKKVASQYKENNKGKTLQVLLDELSAPPKPPTPPKIEVRKEPNPVSNSQISEEELQAKAYLERGDIDRAIMAYRRIRPVTVRILKIIGQLSAEEKHDYDTAIECYELALKMQDETDDNLPDTLLRLGICYYRCGKFDLAINCHTRALSLYESVRRRDTASMITCLTTISCSHRARKELTQALDYAQRAWTLCESNESKNDIIVATSLASLASIHHDLTDDAQALRLGTRALGIFERTRSSNPFHIAELLNTLGLVKMNLGDLPESRHYFERALKIYSNKAPLGQSEKVQVEKNLECVLEMQQNTDKLQHYS